MADPRSPFTTPGTIPRRQGREGRTVGADPQARAQPDRLLLSSFLNRRSCRRRARRTRSFCDRLPGAWGEEWTKGRGPFPREIIGGRPGGGGGRSMASRPGHAGPTYLQHFGLAKAANFSRGKLLPRTANEPCRGTENPVRPVSESPTAGSEWNWARPPFGQGRVFWETGEVAGRELWVRLAGKSGRGPQSGLRPERICSLRGHVEKSAEGTPVRGRCPPAVKAGETVSPTFLRPPYGSLRERAPCRPGDTPPSPLP